MDNVRAVNQVLQVLPIENNTIKHFQFKNEASIDESVNISEEDISKEELEKAVEKANEQLLGLHAQFDFKVHEGTGRTVVRLIDKQTEKVIKEIPSEKMLDVIASIWDLSGIVVDRKE